MASTVYFDNVTDDSRIHLNNANADGDGGGGGDDDQAIPAPSTSPNGLFNFPPGSVIVQDAGEEVRPSHLHLLPFFLCPLFALLALLALLPFSPPCW